jgi:alpha-galactosidase
VGKLDWLHERGFKIGIYTSASASACGGNWGSRGHETADALAFREWGIDWVKVCSLSLRKVFHTHARTHRDGERERGGERAVMGCIATP